jgi:arylsulfatase A-like enzyme
MTASRYVRNGYLPGEFQGTPIDAAGKTPEQMVLNLRSPNLSREKQQRQLDFIRSLNRGHREQAGVDAALDARIRAMETAFRMQFAAGEALDVNTERKAVREEYGAGWFANACLLSRRLVERGVRYIHVEHSRWDDHDKISKLIPKHCKEVDQPMAALLKDLKRRGLLDETLVIWGGEFGRTPVSENGDGRDHNHYGFSIWMAGGGIKGGITHGATDDFGFRAVHNRVEVNDLHATILHLLGLDHEKLTYRYSGRDFRLTDVAGHVVRDILA